METGRMVFVKTKQWDIVFVEKLENSEDLYTWLKCSDGNIYRVSTYDYSHEINHAVSVLQEK